jgi:hypothetical protein
MSKIDNGAEEGVRNGISRSPEWPRVEKAHLERQPRCVCCGPSASASAPVQVHHMFPFHYCVALGRPDLELDDRNLITLCEDEAGRPGQNHHLLVGHLDDFQSSNLAVREDATTTFSGMTAPAIRADPRWVNKCASRLKPLDQMTEDDKQAFKDAMNERFPRVASSSSRSAGA